MKWKRPLAIAALAVIALLYLSTLIASFLGSPASRDFLMAAIFCTVAIPAALYAYQMAVRMRKHREENSDGEESGSSR